VKQSRDGVGRHAGSASRAKSKGRALSRPTRRLCGRQLRQLTTFVRGCPSASGHLDCPIANVRHGCPIANARRRCPIANAGPS